RVPTGGECRSAPEHIGRNKSCVLKRLLEWAGRISSQPGGLKIPAYVTANVVDAIAIAVGRVANLFEPNLLEKVDAPFRILGFTGEQDGCVKGAGRRAGVDLRVERLAVRHWRVAAHKRFEHSYLECAVGSTTGKGDR